MTQQYYLQIPTKKETKIIFCMPGPVSGFSGDFFDSWTELIVYCLEKKIKFNISRHHSSVVYYARNQCLGGDVLKGKNQLPFNNQFDYTHLMWIDSDIIFTPKSFQTLLDHDKDIVSGIYKMKGGQSFATVKDWNEEYFKKNGTFKFLVDEDVKDKKDLIEVDYTGLGWMLIKKGIFEKMEYPWFRPLWKNFGGISDFTSEDTAFCLIAKEKGFKIYIDPTVRVGHEKSIIY